LSSVGQAAAGALGAVGCAQLEDMASAQSTSANDLMSLMLSIELSILFCD
jgi:hypothetical protein